MKKINEVLNNHKQIIIISCITSFFWVLLFTASAVTGILPITQTARRSVTNELSGRTIISNEIDKESQIVDIFKKTSPAVVSIIITKDVPVLEQYYRDYDPFGGFGGFFGGFGGFQIPQYRQKGTEKKEVGGGTGFFVSSDGLIVTNRHVVGDEGATYTVLTNDGKKYDATILTKDTLFDIALIQIEGSGFPYLEFGNSDELSPGQTAIAIGNTLAEFSNSVSVGVISGLSRSIIAGDNQGNREHLSDVIQTDAAINPGNSGGPLLSLHGEVIGVNVAQAQGSENVGFALPANTVKGIVSSVREFGEIVRPYLGIRYIPITPELVERNNLTIEQGVIVSRGENRLDLAVIPGSPADKAGILENDIIISVDSKELGDGVLLNEVIGQKKVGDTVVLKIWRKGDLTDIPVKLQKMPSKTKEEE